MALFEKKMSKKEKMDNQAPTTAKKIVMIGGPSVGKTCIIQRFYKSTFNDATTATIHANCVQKNVSIKEGSVLLEVWDTAGQEKYRSISPLFFRNALACVSVFDSTSEESLSSCFDYINDFLDSEPDGKVVVCANKVDLLNEEVTENELIQDAQRQCEREKFPFFICSAKTGEGVDNLFSCIAKTLYDAENNQNNQDEAVDIRKEKKDGGCAC